MSERIRSETYYQSQSKMANDIGPRKTMFVLVVVVGCFAILWPKVFYPMLVGSANQHMKPSEIDKTTGCCDVISETDVNVIEIMSQLCSNIISKEDGKVLTGREIVSRCKAEVLKTCGIDISIVLQEKVMLGHTFKQILDEIRSLNGSLCLKYNFGVSPWRLGVRYIIPSNFTLPSLPQERPPHLRPEIVHPAFRERGSAIPHTHTHPTAQRGPPPRFVEGKPGPIPGMRPPMGGAGHVVPPSQKGSSMGIIMPIYTVGVVIFFTYTLMKILFKKQPEGPGAPLYPPVAPDPRFRKEVFEEADRPYVQPRFQTKTTGKLVVNAMSALLDEVDSELEARRKASEVLNQSEPSVGARLANGNISNGSAVKPQEEQSSVKVLGMEMTASCENGKKWGGNTAPTVSSTQHTATIETKEPPQEIYLEGALPAQSRLLVADSATETQRNENPNDPPVVLAGKMTLSLISDIQDGELNGDDLEESKYTTASSATTAENEVSEEEQTDEEQENEIDIEVDVEEDHIEVNDEDNKPNHISESEE